MRVSSGFSDRMEPQSQQFVAIKATETYPLD